MYKKKITFEKNVQQCSISTVALVMFAFAKSGSAPKKKIKPLSAIDTFVI